jgi:stringent starvation protein B
MNQGMTSTRPYLIRAFYDWITDNECTPYLVVNATLKGVDVPEEYVENGQIVFNIAFQSVKGLAFNPDHVTFQARFGGRVRTIYIPMVAVVALYARENGRGMVFTENSSELGQALFQKEETVPQTMDAPPPKNKSKPPKLTLVPSPED